MLVAAHAAGRLQFFGDHAHLADKAAFKAYLIPYTKFALALRPVALVGLFVTAALIALFHRAEFAGAVRLEAPPPKVDANRVLVIRALLATLILIALFFAGVVPAKAAIIIGGLHTDSRTK
jgi:Na+/H+ antiporter NhaD/arsenite permease-like protein